MVPASRVNYWPRLRENPYGYCRFLANPLIHQFEHQQRVSPNITLGMKLRRLGYSMQVGDLREDESK